MPKQRITKDMVVDAAFEIHSGGIPVAPPVPYGHTWLDPGDVLNAGRGGQAVNHIAVCQFFVGGRYDKNAPGERAGTLGFGDVVFPFLDPELKLVVASLFHYLGIRGEMGLQRGMVCGVVEKHSRIVFKVSFGNAQFFTFRQFYHQG